MRLLVFTAYLNFLAQIERGVKYTERPTDGDDRSNFLDYTFTRLIYHVIRTGSVILPELLLRSSSSATNRRTKNKWIDNIREDCMNMDVYLYIKHLALPWIGQAGETLLTKVMDAMQSAKTTSPPRL